MSTKPMPIFIVRQESTFCLSNRKGNFELSLAKHLVLYVNFIIVLLFSVLFSVHFSVQETKETMILVFRVLGKPCRATGKKKK